jgi:hypothetical protein
MHNDNRAFVELSWDDETADILITVFHEGTLHQVGMQCATLTTSAPELNDDKMAMLKDLLVQVVELM